MTRQNFTINDSDISDRLHAFDELYEHHFELFIALCKCISYDFPDVVWRSQKDSNGIMCPGWFLMGIQKEPGTQITYYFQIERWKDTAFAETLDYAPEWDGHTSRDVLARLRGLHPA